MADHFEDEIWPAIKDTAGDIGEEATEVFNDIFGWIFGDDEEEPEVDACMMRENGTPCLEKCCAKVDGCSWNANNNACETYEEPEYTCAVNGKNGKDCGEQCCGKQDQFGITCHWDGSTCMDGEKPKGDDYAECVMTDKMWKKGLEVKKKGKNAEACYKLCKKSKGFKNGKKCVAWSYNADTKKSCTLYSKNKKSKSKSGVVSGTSDCHPTKGKM